MSRLTQYVEIDKEAKRRRRAHNYEYRFDWPEMAAVDAKLAPLMRRTSEESQHIDLNILSLER